MIGEIQYRLYLQGGVEFPTGGDGGFSKKRPQSANAQAPNRCESGTDSIVWMEEGTRFPVSFCRYAAFFPSWVCPRADFCYEVNRKMNELMEQVKTNGGFLLSSLAIVVIFGLVTRLVERYLPQRRKVSPARRVCIIALSAALAAVLYTLDFPLPFLAPGFYKLDFSELPVMLCGFFLGPSAAVTCEAGKALIKLLLKGTTTAFVGDLANFVVGCSFVLPAAIWYHLRKSRHSALVGLILGTLCMTAFGSLFNAVYLLPKFAQLYGIPLNAIIAMGTEIWGGVSGVPTFVMLCVAPLNLVKGAAVSLLTMLLYKKAAAPLSRFAA